ncbi:cation diffusion facilitator family transporter [Leucobacter sp. W1153]|uniref:cation diffusion facilitator family transporter n=1 Tax=Leucobacter sp. W1153 TaxID=3439064 RepID=UPI003F389F02
MAEHAGAPKTATAFYRRRLALVLLVTLSVAGVQVVGSVLSGSLSLLADAAHMLTDSAGVAIALGASFLATLPATAARTFGYLRVEVLAALINGLILCVVSIVVLVEALRRLGQPVEVNPGIMLIAAVIGAVANLISLLMLQRGQRESLNVRGAYLEVLGDLLGSIAVIAAALIIWVTGLMWVDQAASILIALLILPRALSLLRDVVEVLLEATPRGIDTEQIRTHLAAIPGVIEVHDLHAWTITSGVLALSAHVTVRDDIWNDRDVHAVLDEAKACLREHFHVDHSTLQLEPSGHRRAGPQSHR